jgi:hypothetical protein
LFIEHRHIDTLNVGVLPIIALRSLEAVSFHSATSFLVLRIAKTLLVIILLATTVVTRGAGSITKRNTTTFGHAAQGLGGLGIAVDRITFGSKAALHFNCPKTPCAFRAGRLTGVT